MPQDETKVTTRRRFLEVSGAALAAVATVVPMGEAQERKVPQSADHTLPNEEQPGPNNAALDAENPNSVWAPETDEGSVKPFKYSFGLTHKRITDGGWTRQVTERELPISKAMAGVEMRLIKGGVRELHWHPSAEWAYMIYGTARITAVDAGGTSFVNEVAAGDLWLFPGGIPHSIQGMGPDGCKFLLVFNEGNFNEFETFLLSDWFAHTPKEVLAKNFNVPESTFANAPKKELYIFATDLPRPLEEEQKAAAMGSGANDTKFLFRASTMAPTKVSHGGEVRIVDSSLFPVTPIAAAIVTLKPGGLREMHWHPLSDEWQYYVSGKGRMTVFEAGAKARTLDFEEGDVGYINMSNPHFIENTGTEDLVFLEMFPIGTYQDISAAEWLAHTPAKMVDEHLKTGEGFVNGIPKAKAIVVPA